MMCHAIGTVVPPRWQRRATAMAHACHGDGTSVTWVRAKASLPWFTSRTPRNKRRSLLVPSPHSV